MQRLHHMHAFTRIWFVIAALALPGCAWLDFIGYGDTEIDTARKAVVVADAEVRSGYLLLESLIKSRSISASDARKAKTALDDARAGIRLTFSAIKLSGDEAAGADTLTMALAALNVAMTIMGAITSNQNN